MSERLEEIAQQLRERGFRLTPQRLSILRTVLNRPDHPTAEDVFKQARQRMPTVSLTTVYHTLEMLVEVGAFTRVSPYSDMRRYDKRVEDHVHVICSKCGWIVDAPLPNAGFELPGIQESTGFVALKPITAFAGVCPKCQIRETPVPEGLLPRNGNGSTGPDAEARSPVGTPGAVITGSAT